MEDNHEDEREQRAPLRAGRGAGRRARSTPGSWSGCPSPTPTGRTLRLAVDAAGELRAQPAAGVLRARRAGAAGPRVARARARRRVGGRGDPRRPLPGAHGPGQQGARRGGRRDEGPRASSTRSGWSCSRRSPTPSRSPSRCEQALLVYRETHPWVRESDLSPKSVVRDMYEQGLQLHRVRRALRARALRGPRAALPQQRLPRAAPDGARRGEDRRARRDRRVARRDGPPDRLQPARRVGGADRSRVRRARGGRDRGR